MAKLETKLEIIAGNNPAYNCIMTDNYSEVVASKEIVNNSNTFKSIASFGIASSIVGDAGARLSGSKMVLVKNNSPVGVELQFTTTDWKDNSNVDATNSIDISGDGVTTARTFSYLLGGYEYMVLPSQWLVSYEEAVSAANAKTIDNKGGYDVNSGNLFADISTVASGFDNTTNPVTFASADGDFWKVGDMIRCNAEVVEITDISGDNITVKRGVLGTSAASHGDGETLRIQFSNDYENIDKYTYSQTNGSGKFKSSNLFGYGRTADDVASGIVKGSFAMKFYNSGYSDIGMTGITPSTHSGLAASTAYTFNIAVDGGSVFADLAFTTDASNLNFGGNNGVISKIQAALDTQFYTAGNLFEKKVSVGIVNGDIRFTSGARTRASAIALAAPTGGGTTPFGVGRLPAVTDSIATAADLPYDTLSDKVYNTSRTNKSVFCYDDGKGNLLGSATGTINYETGALDFTGPANAEFVVSFNYDSAHSGGITTSNVLRTLSARSCNSKIDAEVEILGYV